MSALEQAKQAQQYDYLMKGSLTTSPEQAWEWRHNMMRDAVEGWPATAKALLELAAAAQAVVDAGYHKHMTDSEAHLAAYYKLAAVLGKL